MTHTTHTAAQVLGMVRTAAKANGAAYGSSREARILSATAAYAARVSGMIGADAPKSGWKTGEGFIAALDLRNGNTGELVRKGNLTALERLGHVLAIGFDPNGDDKDVARWGALSDKAGNKEAAEVIGLDKNPTVAKVRKFADSVIRDKARKASGTTTRSPQVPDGTKGETDGKTVVETTPEQRLAVAVKVLRVDLPTVATTDREAFAKFENQISRILASVIKALAAVDKKAADKGETNDAAA